MRRKPHSGVWLFTPKYRITVEPNGLAYLIELVLLLTDVLSRINVTKVEDPNVLFYRRLRSTRHCTIADKSSRPITISLFDLVCIAVLEATEILTQYRTNE